jgi:sugar phosphate isomerase/epimerase
VGEVFVPLLAKYDWKCAIEPLSECNVIRTTYDGLEIVNKVNDPHFCLLADIYHMVLTGQKPSELLDCKGKLIHTHIASENGRKCPHLTDPDDYGAYIDALRAIGYDDCVSVEGGNVDGETTEENISAAVTTLRKYCK